MSYFYILAEYNKQKHILIMKKLSILKEKGTKLSKETMKKVGGGRSWWYCFTHWINVPGIYDGPVGDNGYTWDDCRAE